jgi:plastocyanin
MKTNMMTLLVAVTVGVLALSGCGSSSNPMSPMQPANPGGGGGTQVTISGDVFSSLTVARGTTVTWKNNDMMTHTATADNASAFQFDTGNIGPGATSSGITFTQAGTFAYHCRIHSFMHGTIIVQ